MKSGLNNSDVCLKETHSYITLWEGNQQNPKDTLP